MLTINPLIHQLKTLIQHARNQAYRAVDTIQLQTDWQIGQHIVQFASGLSNSRRTASRMKLNNPTHNL
ncbi:hypothetical protein [Thiomicrospira sp. ALE5]|uniref:hypothetical protein n=1 Tax=Thiomicrospira sp. ALE5 TaxID=748650 RepID=UPI0008E86032|nr:hypothetical protein [Thiomicrospira sp. ALE5]SFR52963.1 hypothetical protein SAMN03092900_0782 [Thiomicrospira sp. ALE5]